MINPGKTQSLGKASIPSARESRYRRRMNLRVKTKEEAIDFINDVGFSFLFPIQNVKMPSLNDQADAIMRAENTGRH